MNSKIKEAQFKIGDIVRVVSPTQAINIELNEETKKLDIEEILLIGDESLIISEIEFLKKIKEFLYKVVLIDEANEQGKQFSLSEEQICYFEEDINEKV